MIVALSVLEVPLELPLDAELPEEERLANDELDEAVAIGDSYGVRVVAAARPRPQRVGRRSSREAERRGTEIIVLGSPRKALTERAARRLRRRPSTACCGTRRAA